MKVTTLIASMRSCGPYIVATSQQNCHISIKVILGIRYLGIPMRSAVIIAEVGEKAYVAVAIKMMRLISLVIHLE